MTDNNQLPPLPSPKVSAPKVYSFVEMNEWGAVCFEAGRHEGLEHFNRAWMRVPEHIRKEVCADDDHDGYDYLADAITRLAALAQRQGEPAGWLYGKTFYAATDPRLTDYIRENSDALYTAPATAEQPAERQPNNEEVICPACTHQFRAIPVQVQRLLLDAGIEPPFLAATAPAPVAPLDSEVASSLLRRLETCALWLRSIADRGREELGDAYPEMLQVLDTVKVCIEMLSAAPAAPVATTGWKLVPIEPTGAMVLNVASKFISNNSTHVREVWKCMLEAAPAAPVAEVLTADDAAAHIMPSDLVKFKRSECTGVAYSIPVGSPDERSVPLFTREQVIAAMSAAPPAGEK